MIELLNNIPWSVLFIILGILIAARVIIWYRRR